MSMIPGALDIINEAEVSHGKDFDPTELITRGKSKGDVETIKYLSTYNREAYNQVDKFSLMGNDAIDAHMKKYLEFYDKAADIAILESEDMVKAYNALNELKVDKALEFIQKLPEEQERINKLAIAGDASYIKEAQALTEKMKIQGIQTTVAALQLLSDNLQLFSDSDDSYSDEEIKKFILESMYEPADKPEEVQRIVKARLAYNNAMINTFKNMIQINYVLFDISKEAAMKLSGDLDSEDSTTRSASIKEIKRLVKENESKFKKKNGIDYRSIGGGYFFVTKEDLGIIGPMLTSDQTLQYAFKYDAIVLGHGSTNNQKYKEYTEKELEKADGPGIDTDELSDADKKRVEIIERLEKEYRKEITRIRDKYENSDKMTEEELDKAEESVKKKYVDRMVAIGNKIDGFSKSDLEALYQDDIDEITKDIINKYIRVAKKHNLNKWAIQPVELLNGQEYTDVNDLVRELIKEGFKNILLMACNPGHHKLDPDILKTPGVKITHSNNSTLVESTDDFDELDCIEQDIIFESIDNAIMSTEEHLNEAASIYGYDSNVNSAYDILLTEGAVSTAWSKVKAFVKKAIQSIIGFFKRIIGYLKSIIEKIKNHFKSKSNKKLAKPIESAVIITENATVSKYKVSNLDDLEKHVVTACDKIAHKIEDLEKQQVTNMQKLDKLLEQKNDTVSESTNIEMERLMKLIFN